MKKFADFLFAAGWWIMALCAISAHVIYTAMIQMKFSQTASLIAPTIGVLIGALILLVAIVLKEANSENNYQKSNPDPVG